MPAKPTLLYYECLQYQPDNRQLLDTHFRVLTLPDPSHDTPDILQQAEICLAPLGYFFGQEKIDLTPRLRIIGSNTTGEQHIDTVYAEQRGVRVLSLRGERDFLRSITPTAELTFGLLIALSRHMIPALQSVHDGRWERRPFGGEAMLSRMHLGIAGLGRLGTLVARYGRAFGMTVRYFDPVLREDSADLVRCDSLESLVAASDAITVHLPYTPGTPPAFTAKLLARCKRGAWLINTARGELIDPQALLAALGSGQLAGAATDVLDGEFVPGFAARVHEHPLVRYARTHANLLITPHIGGSTKDAWHLTEAHVIRRLVDAVGGKAQA